MRYAAKVLYKAMAKCCSPVKLDPEGVLADLAANGYTITSAEPAAPMTDEKLREAVDWLKERIEGAESIGDPRPCKKAREHHAALETALSELADLRAKLKQFPSSNAGDVK